jgi:type II secretory ATPase GspE/PulE/Tfp pilus assembly ATPase PilB-like protein
MPTLVETLASGLILVSFWKPLILFMTIGLWAWVVSGVFDKHAARFYLNRSQWNIIHLCVGSAALAIALAIPMKHEAAFWIGWAVMTLVLIGDLYAYAFMANRDERVPEAGQIRLSALQKLAAARNEKKKAKGAGQVKLTIRMPDKSVMPAPAAETPEYEVRVQAEDLFLKALAARAAQVDLAPSGKDGSYTARQLIDGVPTNGDTFPGPTAVKLIDFWKSTAKLDIADRRRKLTGDAAVELGASKHKVRVTGMGVQGGMRLTLLFDPDKAVNRKPEDLGLLPEQMEEMKILTGITRQMPDGSEVPGAESKGVVVLGGVPDGGRTTTLYTLAKMHDAYTSSVQTLELEQQLNIEGVRHTVFDASVEGADFATSARSLLRRDPDVLLVAEMPDANTAKEIAKSDVERTRSYISVRANNALEALEIYLKGVGDNAQAAKGLRGVVCQKLMRKLCTNCRVGYPPSAEMLKKMGVPAGAKVEQLFKKGGQVLIKNKPEVCPVCGGGGYVGQEGLFEIYRFDQECRDMIAAGNMPGLKNAIRKKNPPTIQQVALRKALAGITSVEEVMRVTAPPAAAAPAPAPGAAPAAPKPSGGAPKPPAAGKPSA